MPWKIFWILAAIVVLLGFSPMLGVIVAGTVAALAGCPLDGSPVRPCLIAGADCGNTLYNLSLLGWLTIQAVPLAALALGCVVVIQIGFRRLRRR